MAIVTNQDDFVFVSRYEFGDLASEGEIAILSPKGQYIRSLLLPGYSEINGLQFSRCSDKNQQKCAFGH